MKSNFLFIENIICLVILPLRVCTYSNMVKDFSAYSLHDVYLGEFAKKLTLYVNCMM